MEINIGRVMLEFLASIIIQFTPVDAYLAGDRTWTWGDNMSRWYVLQPVTDNIGTAVFTLERFDGEVNSGDSITIYARKDRSGKYIWSEYKRNYDAKPLKFLQPVMENSWGSGRQKRFFPSIWNSKEGISMTQQNITKVEGADCREFLFSRDQLVISVIIGKPGVIGFSLSQNGKKFNDAENRVQLVKSGGPGYKGRSQKPVFIINYR